MSSVRELIISQLVSTLESAPTIGAPVYRSRVTPLMREESPAIIIEPIIDQANQIVVPKLDWSLTVRISIIVRGDIPDQLADPIAEKVHAKVMTDLSVGGYAYDVQPQSVSFDLLDADNSAGLVSMEYLILYRTSLTDITVV